MACNSRGFVQYRHGEISTKLNAGGKLTTLCNGEVLRKAQPIKLHSYKGCAILTCRRGGVRKDLRARPSRHVQSISNSTVRAWIWLVRFMPHAALQEDEYDDFHGVLQQMMIRALLLGRSGLHFGEVCLAIGHVWFTFRQVWFTFWQVWFTFAQFWFTCWRGLVYFLARSGLLLGLLVCITASHVRWREGPRALPQRKFPACP